MPGLADGAGDRGETVSGLIVRATTARMPRSLAKNAAAAPSRDPGPLLWMLILVTESAWPSCSSTG
jgi:hypothetical protein